MMVRQASSPEIALDAGAVLGECPVWHPAADHLLWVDCVDGVVHRFDPSTGFDVALHTGQRVGSVEWRRGGGLVVASGGGFGYLDEASGTVKPATSVGPEPPDNVMNDGACDVTGRFWAGTASRDKRPTAGLYRFDPDGTVTRVVDSIRMSNGIGWSPDNLLMYYVDSSSQGLDVFDFDADTGTVRGRRRLIDIDARCGIPDGLTVDATGCVWLALWGPGLVRRYTPRGDLDVELSLPTSQTTSCTFGGPELDLLYITSARMGLTAQQQREQPHAGALFAVAPGVTGLPAHGFAG